MFNRICGVIGILFVCVAYHSLVNIGVHVQRHSLSFKELQLLNHRDEEDTTSYHSTTLSRDADSLLRICKSSQISQQAEYSSSLGKQWFHHAEDRQLGQWFYGQKYIQKTIKRAISGNLGCVKGKLTTCLERFGDNFITQWQQQPDVSTGCHHPAHAHAQGIITGSLSCKEQNNDLKQTLCVLTNAHINFRRMETIKTCPPHEKQHCYHREITAGFLQLACPVDDPLIESTLTSNLHLSNSGSTGHHGNENKNETCDITLTDDIIIFSANEIENLGHTLEDFMNIWLMLHVAQSTRHTKQRVTILVVDQLHGGLGRFTADQSLFYRFLETLYHRVIYASSIADKILCSKKLITFTSPRDRFPFIFGGMEYAIECSFRGPSALYQRWNLFVRESFGTLGASALLSSPAGVLNVLLILRGNSSQQVHQQANRDFSSETKQKLIGRLKKITSIKLAVVDLGQYSMTEQMRIISDHHVIIGMHGAALSLAVHMSIGAPHCCAVIEIFNSRTKFGSYQFHGNALRSVGIHYTRINTIGYSSQALLDTEKTEEEADNKAARTYACPLYSPLSPLSSRFSSNSRSQSNRLLRSQQQEQQQHQKHRPSSMDAVDIDPERVVSALRRTMHILQGSDRSKDQYALAAATEGATTKHKKIITAEASTHLALLRFNYSRSASCLLPAVWHDRQQA